jgi:hypothetical protein
MGKKNNFILPVYPYPFQARSIPRENVVDVNSLFGVREYSAVCI